ALRHTKSHRQPKPVESCGPSATAPRMSLEKRLPPVDDRRECDGTRHRPLAHDGGPTPRKRRPPLTPAKIDRRRPSFVTLLRTAAATRRWKHPPASAGAKRQSHRAGRAWTSITSSAAGDMPTRDLLLFWPKHAGAS